jgi:purine-nucleoside/S-methyl-5'-thioadenosine phosphorylase / adenosine deaminase
VFHLDAQHIYHAGPLDDFEWLVHGFGTRQSAGLAGNGNLATLRQVHSANCIAAVGRTGVLGEGDALVENTPGQLVGVKTADCLPILLVDPEHRAVAAVHAGWRGTVRGVVCEAVRTMQAEFGTRPATLHAAIGPGIGPCCYEVGPEVAAQFGASGTARIDLADANRRQLLEAGVAERQIYAAGLCTMCRAAEFHSYRRDREHAGRMLSVVGVR